MDYKIRAVRADEWRAMKELRLAALRDPVAGLAFLETYENAAAQADEFWQARAQRSAHGTTALQFVAEEESGGRWVGSVAVLLEEAGAEDWAGEVVERRQAHLVGVYLRPEARGSGVAEELFRAAVDWAFGLEGITRMRLFVHQDNERAEAAYRKFGFVRTGETVPKAGEPGKIEREMELSRP